MKNKRASKENLKFIVLLGVLILAIGYAIVTTTIMLVKTSPNRSSYTIRNNNEETDINEDTNNNSHKNSNSLKSEEDYEDPNFAVYYISNDTSPSIIKGMGTAHISDDGKTAVFDFSGMARKGDTAAVRYTIYNNSYNSDAALDIKITNSNSEYFKVYKKLETTKLKSKETTTVTITVELLATPIEGEKKASISGTIIAKPIKK